ncbi:NAD-dependent glutamate dehydrogenase [Coemansia sp. RSA 2607]|nr:NAD-dependent glutamate dehydrogenase [Coemansia sp. RSA 2607]
MTVVETLAPVNHSGYTDNVYSGKQEHRAQVNAILEKEDAIPKHRIESEVGWFYDTLGLDDMYFMVEKPETVAGHITALYGSSLSSSNTSKAHSVGFESRYENGAMFIHNSVPGISKTDGVSYEKM